MNLSTKHKILMALANLNKPATRAEISASEGISTDNIGPHLRRFVKEGLAEKVAYGLYLISSRGKEQAESLKKKYGTDLPSEQQKAGQQKIDNPPEERKAGASPAEPGLTAQEYEAIIDISADIKKSLKFKFGEKNVGKMIKILKKLLE